MAYLKGVDLSGSSDISGSIGIFGQVTGSSFTGSFSGSFTATEISATDLTVSGTASIGYLETIYETASIIYSSGSTKFGDTLDDTHIRTGSLLITGSSYTINGEDIIITSALNAATSSLSSSLAVDIAANSASISNVESFPYTGSAIISGSLIVTGSTNISGSVTAYGFNIDDNATGTPAIYSSTNLNLSASNAVVVTDSPFRVASLTDVETGSFTSQDGDIIFNSTRAAYMVYSGSAWREVIIEGFTASYASQALSSSYDLTASYAENVPSGTGFPYTGSAIVSGSLIVTGSIYSDSTIFATASHAISASYAISSSQAENANTASYVTTAQTASYVETAQTASYIAGANVDGTVTSASYAANGGVTSIAAGSGIVINQSTGNITISTDTIPGGSVASSSFTNATGASLIHNFGSTNVIVTVYNENGDEIIPSSISLLNDNTVNVSFSSPESGDIVAIEAQTGEFATASFSSTGSVTLNHSLGTQDLNIVAYNTSNVQFIPDIEILDSSNVKATFAAPTSGKLLAVARDGSVSASFSNTVNETITHNLSGSAIFVTVYDTSYNEILPDSVSIVDTNSINLTFAASSSGNVVIAGGAIDATSAEIATTYNQPINGSSSYTIIHNLNAEWPLVQVYDSASRAQVRDYTITSIDASRITATFTSSFNGFVIINS